ncbi:MAG: DUF1569 domain-containing protein [Vicinamibacteria bacterium]
MRSFARPADHADILRRLATLTPDRERRWGRMTAHEAVCHMADAFRMAGGSLPVVATGRLAHRTLLKWVVLYAPVRWPTGIRSSPELDQARGGGSRPADFAADLEALCRLADSAAAPGTRAPHPLFGPLSHAAWLRWAWLHTDHHLRQFGA